MTQETKPLAAYAMLGLVVLLWAGNAIVARAVRVDIPPVTLAFLRWSLAFLIVAPFALRGVWRDRAALLAAWKPVLALGLLGVGAFNTILYTGLHYTTATNALLLQAAIPACVMLLDRFFFGVRAHRWQICGVALSILGVAGIVFRGDLSAVLGLELGMGDAIVLAAVAAWSLYTVFLRLRPAVAPASFIAVTFAIGAIAQLPFFLAERQAGLQVNWTPHVFAALAYVALLPSLVAYFIYNWATGKVGPARAGQAITMMPLFGALLSALLLGEALHLYHVVGMALILAGIALSALAMRRPERRQQAAGARQGAALEDGS